MKYKASMDRTCKIITWCCIIVFIALGQMNVRELINANGDTTIILVHAFILLQFVLILGLAWIYAPQYYILDTTDIIIHRAVGDVKIKLADIKETHIMEEQEMKGITRTFGVGGLFGYYGRFHVPKIGAVRFYATQNKNRILLTTADGKKILLTPDDMGMFEVIKR